jgi:hypothetical protein
MVNNKMFVGIIKDQMMCRIDPDMHDTAIEMTGCRTMDFTKRLMRGYVMIDDRGIRTKREFDFWIELCPSRKKRKNNLISTNN